MTPPYKKKLIEVALPLEDINREAAREKSIRHGHPSTLHLWWARRPLAACRAVLFSSLVDDPSECVTELMADAGKRRAAEKVLAAQRKAWEGRKAVFDKAAASGVSASSNPPPGLEPKLEEILVETERERLFNIIRELVKWENSNNERVLSKARAEILRSTGGNPPPVYDPFCGGGSIPLEAQRLGLQAHASDLNPVPVLINKALIEIPPKFAGKPPMNPDSRKKLGASGSWKGAAGLAEDIRYYGQWMRDEAEKRIGHLYPKVKLPKEHGGGEATVIAWLWARTVASPNPAAKGAHVPLVRSFWLSTKPGRKAWVEPVVAPGTSSSRPTYGFEVRTEQRAGKDARAPGGTVSRNGGACLLTGSPMPLEYIRGEGRAGRMGARLMAVIVEGPTGRIYLPPSEEHERLAQSAQPLNAPDTDLPQAALGFRVQNYGMTKHRHLFTNRQLAALTTFSDLIDGARTKVLADAGIADVSADVGQAYADSVATYLAFALDRVVDRHSTIATWDSSPSKLQLRNTFARQAVQMTWDFGEGNPLCMSSGTWTPSVEFVAKVVTELPARGTAAAQQLNAADLAPKDGGGPWLFSTDPPYYDNVPYADLSDFFYVWLRRCLQQVYPKLLGTMLVPKAEELIAEPFRHGGKDEARSFFERGMGRVLERMRAACDPRFPTTIYYAFKQAEDDGDSDDEDGEPTTARASTGWETFLQGLADAGWQIDGTWPMRTELGNRMRSMASNALASSIVLVCRPRPKDASVASRRDLLAALKRELPEALRNLQKGNIAPVDLAQAAIGPGMAVFSRYARVLEADGSPMSVRTALSLINQSLDEVLAEQEGEFDADTRWALAWFDQNGFNEGAYGLAETLCTAKNTSVSGMTEAGILAAKGGKVRLLKKEELPADWDPAADERLTVWEATHHLIRSLDSGEQAAAALLKKLGAMAEVARDLSYRLYTVCERRKWAQDAIGYNALVLSWPDLKRLADEQQAAGPAQRELI
jgi:putative DNA methylase